MFSIILSTCKKDEPASSSVITIVIPKEVKVIKNESWEGNLVSLDSSNYTITFSNTIPSAKGLKKLIELIEKREKDG